MFCPSCSAEFMEGVKRCANCDVELVATLPAGDLFTSPERMAAALKDKELEAIVVGSQVAVREAQRQLAGRRIPSVIAGEAQDEGQTAVHARFFLMVENERLEAARTFFREQWQRGLAGEGLMLKDNLSAGEGKCPACEAVLPETASECPECGLFLGDPDAVK